MDEKRLEKAIAALRRRVADTSIEQVAHEIGIGRESVHRLTLGGGIYLQNKVKILSWYDSLGGRPAHIVDPDKGFKAIMLHIKESPWKDERKRRAERYIARLIGESGIAVRNGRTRPIKRSKKRR